MRLFGLFGPPDIEKLKEKREVPARDEEQGGPRQSPAL